MQINRLYEKNTSGARDPYRTEISNTVQALRAKLMAEGLRIDAPPAAPIKLRVSETPAVKPRPDAPKSKLKRGTQPGYVILKEIRD
jgi:hypothetical protein